MCNHADFLCLRVPYRNEKNETQWYVVCCIFVAKNEICMSTTLKKGFLLLSRSYTGLQMKGTFYR